MPETPLPLTIQTCGQKQHGQNSKKKLILNATVWHEVFGLT